MTEAPVHFSAVKESISRQERIHDTKYTIKTHKLRRSSHRFVTSYLQLHCTQLNYFVQTVLQAPLTLGPRNK